MTEVFGRQLLYRKTLAIQRISGYRVSRWKMPVIFCFPPDFVWMSKTGQCLLEKRRREVMHDANIRQAHNAGRYAQMMAIKHLRSHWQYRHSGTFPSGN
jgi:hypothetical protein